MARYQRLETVIKETVARHMHEARTGKKKVTKRELEKDLKTLIKSVTEEIDRSSDEDLERIEKFLTHLAGEISSLKK